MPILHLGRPLLFVTSSTYRQPADMPPQPGSKPDYPQDLRTWSPRRNYALVDPLLLEQRRSTVVDRQLGSRKDYPNDLRTWIHQSLPNLLPNVYYSFPFDWQLAPRVKPIEQTWLEPGNNFPPVLPSTLPVGVQLFDRQFFRQGTGQSWLSVGNGLTAFPTGNQLFDRPFIKPTSGLTWLGTGNGLTSFPTGTQFFDRPILSRGTGQSWLETGNNFPPIPSAVLFPAGSQLFDRPFIQRQWDKTWLEAGNNTPVIPNNLVPTPFDWQLTYPTPFRGFDHPEYNSSLLAPTVVPAQPYFSWHGQWPKLQQTIGFPNTTVFLTPAAQVTLLPQPFDWQLIYRQGTGKTLVADRTIVPVSDTTTTFQPTPFDWQVTRPTYAGQTWLEPGNNFPPLPIVVVNLPYNQYDWPLPGRFRPLGVWAGQENTQFLPTPVMPPYAYDWPNPKAYQRDITVNDVQNNPVFPFIPPFIPPPVTDVHFMPFIGSVGQMKCW